jgi:RNA polymerase sigma factor (sigma-70 family)
MLSINVRVHGSQGAVSDVEFPWSDAWLDRAIIEWCRRCHRVLNVPLHDAEDIVEDALVGMLRDAQAGKIDVTNDVAVKGYMWKRIVWRSLTYHKKKQSPSTGICVEAEVMAVLPSPAPGPEEETLAREDAEEAARAAKALHDVLAALPPKKKQHALLVAEGLKPHERAEALGVSPGAERVAWLRLKRRLKAMMAESTFGKEGTV